MSTFLLNPYDATLNLNNKDDRKLFQDACKGLKEKDLYGGERDKYSDFVKLIEKHFNATRVMQALQIATKWKDDASTTEEQQKVAPNGTTNLFSSNKVDRTEVVSHCDRVWCDLAFGDPSLKDFQTFTRDPRNDTELNEARNHRRLKHVMMGQMVWNSLGSKFQIELMPHKHEFQRGHEYDGPLLWDFIRRRVKPSTTVGASRLKDDIENKTLEDFNDDVTKYNSWFTDTRDQIIREEGEGYNEYTRSLFKAYRKSSNEDFREAIASEKRSWTQGRLPDTYTYLDLMELARLEYNNAVEDDTWSSNKSRIEKESRESNILALATQLLQKANLGNGSGPKQGDGNGTGGTEKTQFHPWRFENPNNDKTKLVRGSTMKWCDKDCHPQPMWCGRKACMSKSEYAEFMDGKRKGKGKEDRDKNKSGKQRISKDFRIALAALTTAEDFASLEDQFFAGKE